MSGYRRITGQRVWNKPDADDTAIPATFFDGNEVPVKAYCYSIDAGGVFKRNTSQTAGIATLVDQVFVIGEDGEFLDPLALKKARFTGKWEVVILYVRGGE
jgi:hypothetical protein